MNDRLTISTPKERRSKRSCESSVHQHNSYSPGFSNIPMNTFVARVCASKFLQKIAKDAELLEPLIPTCRSCLEHRHSYVRKNAVFALYSIHHEFENLIPDAAELMYTFLIAESDSTCKRDAFVFLAHCSVTKAVGYFL